MLRKTAITSNDTARLLTGRAKAARKPPAKTLTGKPPKSKLITSPISLRVSDAQLAALDKLELLDGVQRSAQIQRAIAEYIERRNQSGPNL